MKISQKENFKILSNAPLKHNEHVNFVNMDICKGKLRWPLLPIKMFFYMYDYESIYLHWHSSLCVEIFSQLFWDSFPTIFLTGMLVETWDLGMPEIK